MATHKQARTIRGLCARLGYDIATAIKQAGAEQLFPVEGTRLHGRVDGKHWRAPRTVEELNACCAAHVIAYLTERGRT